MNRQDAMEQTHRIESGVRHKAILFAFLIDCFAVICGFAIIKRHNAIIKRIFDITNVPSAIGFRRINGKTIGQFEQIIRSTIHILAISNRIIVRIGTGNQKDSKKDCGKNAYEFRGFHRSINYIN